MNVVVREFRLASSSLTYAITLLVKLNSTNKTFICFVKAPQEVLGVSKSPTII
jgi:hypothetical protein